MLVLVLIATGSLINMAKRVAHAPLELDMRGVSLTDFAQPICLQETEWVYNIYIYIDVYCLQFCPSQMRALMVLVVQSSMVHTESQHHSSSGHHLYCGLQYPISNLVEMSSYFDHHGERMISGRVVDSHSKHVLGVIRGLCHLLQSGCKYFY